MKGPSGLIATAHPSFRPEWQATEKQLVWPNGARAYVRTPERPGKIRGLEYDLSWETEIQSWPIATREEAHSNVEISTRLDGARRLWDATSKRRHPVLRELRDEAKADPEKHVLVRGSTYENRANLAEGYVEGLERKYAGTARGREELHGEDLDDEIEGALVKQDWIDKARRYLPGRIARRVVSVDPAVTNKKGSDTTGIIDAGVGFDGQCFVFGDHSGKIDVGAWADIVLNIYVTNGCELVLAETNKGGQLVTQNLRVAAAARGLTVIVVGRDERPHPVKGTVFVKEVFARGAKEDRAEPVATAYQRGRVSHVHGVDLRSLEDTLTTWEPAPNAESPGDLDALVHAAVELLDLNVNKPDGRAGFDGLEEAARRILAPGRAATPLPSFPSSRTNRL